MKLSSYLRRLIEFPLLPVWLAPLLFFLPTILVGKALFWGTPYLQFVPWRAEAWVSLVQGQLPLWNPLVGMGAPLLANYQSALFYPPNWILLIFQWLGGAPAQAWAQTLVIWLHLAWGGAGMVWIARRLGCGKFSQTVAGTTWALCMYAVTRSGFLSVNAAVAWLPWLWACADQIAGPYTPLKKNWFEWVSAVISMAFVLALQLLAGHAQTTWYSLCLAIVWIGVWSLKNGGINAVLRCACAAAAVGLMAACLAAVQLIPTAEYLAQSQRATAVDYQTAMTYSFWPWHLITLIAPDFFGNPAHEDYWYNTWFWEDAIYIGILPLLVGVIGCVASLIKHRNTLDTASQTKNISLFAAITLGVAVLLGLGRFTPVYPFLYRYIPTFNMFQAPARWMILGDAALVIMAALGLESWHRPRGRALYWSRLAVAGAAAVSLGAGIAWTSMGSIQPTFIRATAIAGFLGVLLGVLNLTAPIDPRMSRNKLWMGCVVLVVALDLIAADWGSNPDISSQFYQVSSRATENVQQLAQNGRLWISQADESTIKFDRFLRVKSFTPLSSWDDWKSALLPDANILAGIASTNNFDPLVPGRYANWMTLIEKQPLSVEKQLLALMDVGAIESVTTDAQGGSAFETSSHYGRFSWAPCAQYVSDGDTAWLTLVSLAKKSEGSVQPMRTVIIEGMSDKIDNNCDINRAGKIDIVSETNNQAVIDVDAVGEGWIVQADTWYPGWSVSVDDKTETLYRADYLFRAVRIPAGRHRIVISYKPMSFLVGAGFSLVAVIGLAVFLVKRLRRWPKTEKA